MRDASLSYAPGTLTFLVDLTVETRAYERSFKVRSRSCSTIAWGSGPGRRWPVGSGSCSEHMYDFVISICSESGSIRCRAMTRVV